MQLNAISLGIKDSIEVGTAQVFLGVNIYNSFKVDLDKN